MTDFLVFFYLGACLAIAFGWFGAMFLSGV